jgi:hypothetical protein
MIDEVLKQLIDFLQTASPMVWETLIKQVYITGLSYVLWGAGLGVASFYCIKVGNYGRRQMEDDADWFGGAILAFVGAALTGVTSFGLLVSAIAHFINPEFYAIQYILAQIGG